jgi:diguanylate cyclase (GGDEF)-like protein
MIPAWEWLATDSSTSRDKSSSSTARARVTTKASARCRSGALASEDGNWRPDDPCLNAATGAPQQKSKIAMLDVRTILAFLGFTSLLMAMALGTTFASDLRSGLPKWIAALVLQACCWAMFAARGALPDFVTVWIANAVFGLSWALKAASLYEFGARPVPKALLWGPTAVAALLFAPALQQDFAVAPVAGGVYFALASSGIAWLVWRLPSEPAYRVQRIMVVSYLVAAAGFVLRSCASAFFPEAVPAPLIATPFQIATYTLGFALIITSSLCLLLMHKARAADILRQQATVDPLTGVFNRRTFVSMAEAALAGARRNHSSAALLMIDIDHFKRINDHLGHLAGDEVLKEFAANIRHCLRQDDILARFGGEEFCVLAPRAALNDAKALAERIRQCIGATGFATRSGALRLTVSIGVATTEGSRQPSLDWLIERADCALYNAKDEGRDRVAFFALNSLPARRLPV